MGQSEQNPGKQERKQKANRKAACRQPIRRRQEPQRGEKEEGTGRAKRVQYTIIFFFF